MKWFAALVFFFVVSIPVVAKQSANKILKKAENIRNPAKSYSVTVKLEDSHGSIKNREYRTKVKGRNKALVEFKKPVNEANKKVLMVDHEMWVKTEGIANPILISPANRVGNASHGDIARLSFVGNYRASVKNQDKNKIVLSMTAIPGRAVTYSKIDYWVHPKTYRPIKAVYKSGSGKILKIGHFEKYKRVLGKSRPTVLRIVDQFKKDRVTKLTFVNAKKEKFSDMEFEKSNMD